MERGRGVCETKRNQKLKWQMRVLGIGTQVRQRGVVSFFLVIFQIVWEVKSWCNYVNFGWAEEQIT